MSVFKYTIFNEYLLITTFLIILCKLTSAEEASNFYTETTNLNYATQNRISSSLEIFLIIKLMEISRNFSICVDNSNVYLSEKHKKIIDSFFTKSYLFKAVILQELKTDCFESVETSNYTVNKFIYEIEELLEKCLSTNLEYPEFNSLISRIEELIKLIQESFEECNITELISLEVFQAIKNVLPKFLTVFSTTKEQMKLIKNIITEKQNLEKSIGKLKEKDGKLGEKLENALKRSENKFFTALHLHEDKSKQFDWQQKNLEANISAHKLIGCCEDGKCDSLTLGKKNQKKVAKKKSPKKKRMEKVQKVDLKNDCSELKSDIPLEENTNLIKDSICVLDSIIKIITSISSLEEKLFILESKILESTLNLKKNVKLIETVNNKSSKIIQRANELISSQIFNTKKNKNGDLYRKNSEYYKNLKRMASALISVQDSKEKSLFKPSIKCPHSSYMDISSKPKECLVYTVD